MNAGLSLSLDRVFHRYGPLDHDTPAEVSFRLAPGDRGLLIGPNGSGKSTLLRRVVGLLAGPGEIRVGELGVAPATLSRIRRATGFLWQNPDDALLLPTVAEDVAFGPRNDGSTDSEARGLAGEWLHRLHISHLGDRRVRDLSLGEKQLVSLAGVLARGPGLLLLDEPTSFLDVAARSRLLAILDTLPTTMLVVSHEPAAWTEAGFQVAASLAAETTNAEYPKQL